MKFFHYTLTDVLPGCLCSIEVTLKFPLMCLILGVYTCFTELENGTKRPLKSLKKKFIFIYFFFLIISYVFNKERDDCNSLIVTNGAQ